jgi:hypothetical protein
MIKVQDELLALTDIKKCSGCIWQSF